MFHRYYYLVPKRLALLETPPFPGGSTTQTTGGEAVSPPLRCAHQENLRHGQRTVA